MRLLVLSDLYHPDGRGGATIFTDLCEGLTGTGLDLTVSTACSYAPEWRDNSGRNGWRVQHERIRSSDIERYGPFIPGILRRRLARYERATARRTSRAASALHGGWSQAPKRPHPRNDKSASRDA